MTPKLEAALDQIAAGDPTRKSISQTHNFANVVKALKKVVDAGERGHHDEVEEYLCKQHRFYKKAAQHVATAFRALSVDRDSR